MALEGSRADHIEQRPLKSLEKRGGKPLEGVLGRILGPSRVKKGYKVGFWDPLFVEEIRLAYALYPL